MKLNYLKVTKDDTEKLSEWLSNDTWPFFLGHSPSQEEIYQRIADGDFFGEGEENFWVICPVGTYIGLIEIYDLDNIAPMFSVRLSSDHRSRGLGKPILEWLTAHIFTNYPDKRRIEAQTREDNIPMRKLFNKCGYVKEAYYRMASPTENGGRVASIAYGILREDWELGKITPVQWSTDTFFSGDKN